MCCTFFKESALKRHLWVCKSLGKLHWKRTWKFGILWTWNDKCSIHCRCFVDWMFFTNQTYYIESNVKYHWPVIVQLKSPKKIMWNAMKKVLLIHCIWWMDLKHLNPKHTTVKPVLNSTVFTLSLPRLHLFSNSPYCLPYNSYNVSSENLILDQLVIP